MRPADADAALVDAVAARHGELVARMLLSLARMHGNALRAEAVSWGLL